MFKSTREVLLNSVDEGEQKIHTCLCTKNDETCFGLQISPRHIKSFTTEGAYSQKYRNEIASNIRPAWEEAYYVGAGVVVTVSFQCTVIVEWKNNISVFVAVMALLTNILATHNKSDTYIVHI